MRASSVVWVCALILLGAILASATESRAGEVEIVIAPNTINLQTHNEWVTVHVDIPFSVVSGAVSLDGIQSVFTKPDNCGNLVAKFNSEDVKAILEVGVVTLTLVGVTDAGEIFTGSDCVRVIDRAGK